MSTGYAAVQWSAHKRRYDALAVGAVIVFMGVYVGVGATLHAPGEAPGPEVLLIRASGACAAVLLHVVLCIGPLARLSPRMNPILFNRRHLGVLTFLVALLHGALSIGYYHGFGVVGPLVSLLTSNTSYGSLAAFPFESLGLAALAILFLLAATSHDFWLKNLSPATWKSLHLSVYVAYALVVMHVMLGAVQSREGWWPTALVGAGVALVAGLHLFAGLRQRGRDRRTHAGEPEPDWLDAGPAADIPMDRARIVRTARGESIALFRHAGGVSALTNVCAHQGGPLGEGAVVDGCVTCPWHGWQYRPEDGCAPPPFTEKVRTYEVRIVAGRVRVNARGLAPGTATPPARVDADEGSAAR